MRSAGGVRPQRQAKIDGALYYLEEIAPDEMEAARMIGDLRGGRDTAGVSWWFGSIREPGAELRVKCATASQVATWPELSAYRGDMYKPDLLWRRVDVVLCKGTKAPNGAEGVRR